MLEKLRKQQSEYRKQQKADGQQQIARHDLNVSRSVC
jgi:hypothetical protein